MIFAKRQSKLKFDSHYRTVVYGAEIFNITSGNHLKINLDDILDYTRNQALLTED